MNFISVHRHALRSAVACRASWGFTGSRRLPNSRLMNTCSSGTQTKSRLFPSASSHPYCRRPITVSSVSRGSRDYKQATGSSQHADDYEDNESMILEIAKGWKVDLPMLLHPRRLDQHDRDLYTLKKLVQHPVSHSIRWQEIQQLLQARLGASLSMGPHNNHTAKPHARPVRIWYAADMTEDEEDEGHREPEYLAWDAADLTQGAEDEADWEPEHLAWEDVAQDEPSYSKSPPAHSRHGRPPHLHASKVNLKVTLAGETQSFHRPAHAGKTLSVDDVMAVRHLLQRAGVLIGHTGVHTHPVEASTDPGTHDPAVSDGRHMLVVLDHQQARIYHAEMKGAKPAARLQPYDPHGFRQHMLSKHHYKKVGSVWRGDWAPEDLGYYQEILSNIQDAEEVILAGHARGLKHNSCAFLMHEMYRRSPHLVDKVAAMMKFDKGTTENQLLADARKLYFNLHYFQMPHAKR